MLTHVSKSSTEQKIIKYLSHDGEIHFFCQIQRKVRLAKLEVVLKNTVFT